jgi:hypothetical protein
VFSVTPRLLNPRERDPMPIAGGWVALGSGLDGSENLVLARDRSPDRPAQGESLYRQSYLGRSSYMKTKESLLYIEVVTFRLVVHQRKTVDSVIWNILQYLDRVCHCFSVSVPRRESVQMSSTPNDTRFQESNHLLRQIEHSTRCGIKYSTVVFEFALFMFLPFQAIPVLEGTRSEYTVKPFNLILFPRLSLLFIC